MFVVFVYSLFENKSNNYCIYQYKDVETNTRITCRGYGLPCAKNITYKMELTEVIDKKYGKQYSVNSYEECIEQSKEGITNYLSCGIIKGIGKKTAERIYAMFGDNSLTVLDKEPELLLKVKGISSKSLAKIKKSYIENRAARKIAEILIPQNFSMKMINKIYSQYKDEAIDIINNHPFRLCDISGITFDLVDSMKKNVAKDDYDRIKAAARQVIINEMLRGSVCVELNYFATKLIALLNTSSVQRCNICEYVIKMIKEKYIRYRKYFNNQREKEEYIYLPNAYKVENSIAQNVLEIKKKKPCLTKNLDVLLNKYIPEVDFDDKQKDAIKIALEEPLFIITGGPGTGKTTILKAVELINSELNKRERITFLSPTGRAARRITESTGKESFTIHKYFNLGISQDSLSEFDTEIEKHDDELFIIDESSFIDIWTADKLTQCIGNSRLGFVGDIDQLPSVGPGSILKDLLESERIPYVRLDTIHRQEDEAINICSNALNIKNGITEINTGSDFIFEETTNLQDTEDKIVNIFCKEVATCGLDNVKCLCPMKKNPAGVFSLNKKLQEKLNPLNGRREFQGKLGMTYRVGDPIMQLVNKEFVANGDTGTVEMISEDEIICTYLDGHREEYDRDNIDEIMLAYATTVHKSQGSEYDVVITCMLNEHGIMRKRNLLYTAITRGKKKVYLLGSKDSINYAIQNNSTDNRTTMLKNLLQVKIQKIDQQTLSLLLNN